MTRSLDSLRRELASAFTRPYPGDENLARTRSDCPGYEGNLARDWLRGKTWQEVLDEGTGDRDLLSFLTRAAWLYFFPAFATLALDLDHPQDFADTLILHLWSFPEEISADLSPRERRAIVHWLEVLAAKYDQRQFVPNDAQRALDDYWAYFTDEELGLTPETAADEDL